MEMKYKILSQVTKFTKRWGGDMSKKIISAIGSDVIEKLLKEMLPDYEIADDIPYQEGLFDALINSEVDILVLNVNICWKKCKRNSRL